MKIVVYRLALLALLLVGWWLVATRVGANLVPTPWATVEAAQRLIAEGRLGKALGESLSIFASGYLLAIAFAVPIGVCMGTFRPLGQTLEVYVYALAATPRVAFIPLIIVFLGLGFQAKLFVVFLGAVMPILLNTYTGVQNVDRELLEMARSIRAGPWQVFRRIVVPGAIPFIIVGLRIGATIGLINTVVAELYTAVSGLGGMLAIYGNTFRMAEYFVVVLTLAALGVTVTEGLRLLENRLGRWRTSV